MFLTRWWSAEISCGLSAAFLWGCHTAAKYWHRGVLVQIGLSER